MPEIHSFDVPQMLWRDWATVFVGLSLGMSVVFAILRMSVKKDKAHKVFTLTNFWLVMSGVIHCWIEYNMVFHRSNSKIKAGLDMYAAADYRYGDYGGIMETGTTAMEAITALIDGPLCFIVAFASIHNYGFHHPLRIILCTMQLYGLLWFTLQPFFNDIPPHEHFSSDPLLFWVVAVGCNAPWFFVPGILIVQSYLTVSETMSRASSNKRE